MPWRRANSATRSNTMGTRAVSETTVRYRESSDSLSSTKDDKSKYLAKNRTNSISLYGKYL